MKLSDIQRKYERSGVIDTEGLKRDTETYLDKTVNVDAEALDLLAGTWAFVAETIEREEWRYYTRAQWVELEHEHVESSSYTEPDLRDDLLARVERGLISLEQAREEYASYRECSYVFCIEVFRPRRRDQRYCCRQCRYKQAEAERRFTKTGTYLPVHVYRDNRDASDERSYRQNETATETETITDIHEPRFRQRETGRKRCRKIEVMSGYRAVKA